MGIQLQCRLCVPTLKRKVSPKRIILVALENPYNSSLLSQGSAAKILLWVMYCIIQFVCCSSFTELYQVELWPAKYLKFQPFYVEEISELYLFEKGILKDFNC